MRATVSKTHQSMGWSPESRIGKWTLALAGLGLGGTVVLGLAFSRGLEPAGSFTDNWLLTGLGAAILASAAASVVTGGLALIRRHDHSWMVLSATGIGVLVTALMLQQVGEGLGWLGS
jgi:hypothetical protein